MPGKLKKDNSLSRLFGDGRPICLLLFVLVLFLVSGCAFFKLNEEMSEAISSTILVGHITTQGTTEGPIVVAAYSVQSGNRHVAHHTVLHECGEYELMVAKGTYTVFAFNDTNKNMVFDEGELAGQISGSGRVQAPAGGVVAHLDIVLRPFPKRVDWPLGRALTIHKPFTFYSRLAGVTTSLEDERFDKGFGIRGFWEPVTFYKELGGTIYFLEEYDPQKIPILFIHGAGATPREWKSFVDNLDRERFQPWFFYYPTGARIRSMAHLLSWKLKNLQVKYTFTNLYMTAHSMGGLVGRSFIMDFWEEFPCVKLFISLATPWGGDKMAEYGVNQSPAIIPSWIDMQPNGNFIDSLFRREFPQGIDFYLFYGFRGNRNPFQTNNDGTISLSSLLDRRAQAEARMSYAYNEDHASILESREVIDQYNAVINMAYAREKGHQKGGGGYLSVDFSYDSSGALPLPWAKLMLKNMEEDTGEIEMTLRPEDSGKKLGPFPGGKYAIMLSAEGFKTAKKWEEADILPNHTDNLSFQLSPDGMITGYVTATMRPEDKVVGMPEWERRPQENSVRLRSVRLIGNGVERNVTPVNEKKFNYFGLEASRTDYLYKGYFRFFGLQPGTYTLLIESREGKTIESVQQVTPGKEQPVVFYELPVDA